MALDSLNNSFILSLAFFFRSGRRTILDVNAMGVSPDADNTKYLVVKGEFLNTATRTRQWTRGLRCMRESILKSLSGVVKSAARLRRFGSFPHAAPSHPTRPNSLKSLCEVSFTCRG